MMREFTLPDVGEGVAEGEIIDWLVAEGDTVTEDQPVVEVETDKAVVEVPSPVNGTIAERRAEVGDVVPVGDVIVVFEVEGEEGKESEGGADTKEDEEAEQTSEWDGEPERKDGPARVFAPPSARRLARELGVEITAISGSRPGGRISEADVRAHARGEGNSSGAEDEQESKAGQTERGKSTKPVESAISKVSEAPSEPEDESRPAVSRADQESERERTLAAPATRKLAEERGVDINAVPTDEERDGQPFVNAEQVREFAERAREEATAVEPEERERRRETVPYRGIRRTIGEQMARSKFTAPHVTHHDEVDVTELVETRSDLKAVAEQNGVTLTYMPFVMKAVVTALREHPYMNSMLDEESEEIVLKQYYNLGVAVGTDAGLMVPVVKRVDEKGLLQLASETNELVSKARERSIAREEMQDGTFTITNFGAIGGEHATPIINYPETAILGLGEITEKPRVVDREIVPRHVLPLSISVDHRVIDGAVAAQFANTLKRYLNDPDLLLLE